MLTENTGVGGRVVRVEKPQQFRLVGMVPNFKREGEAHLQRNFEKKHSRWQVN